MPHPDATSTPADTIAPRRATPARLRLGCVSYLNARPLIDGLESDEAVALHRDVPARLLADLEAGRVDAALCPVVDYHRATVPLVILPQAGGIGSRGETLTVRLFSRVPLESLTRVHVDVESHTSVALLAVLFRERYGRALELVPLEPGDDEPGAVLLIGDKVVTDAPARSRYPHQLDLGEAWHERTGLPFVFAVWMTRADAAVDGLAERLAARRAVNAARIEAIARVHGPAHGWPVELATRYLGQIMRYDVGAVELTAMRRFSELAAVAGLIDTARPLRIWGEK
ncbi:MAG: menaquinone biosynthesis protein [Phycisphaeraceae bacterium]